MNLYYVEDGKFILNMEPHRKISELPYLGDGAFAPSTKKQRQFIYGLCEKLAIDTNDLPYEEPDIHNLTIYEASEIIEILKAQREEYEVANNSFHRPF